VPRCGPRPSWHIPQPADAQPQPSFATSYQPSSSQYMRESMQRRPKRGRPSKVMGIPASTDFESSVHGDSKKWETVTVTTFACTLCGKAFGHKPNLYKHQITAHGRQKKTRPGRSST